MPWLSSSALIISCRCLRCCLPDRKISPWGRTCQPRRSCASAKAAGHFITKNSNRERIKLYTSVDTLQDIGVETQRERE